MRPNRRLYRCASVNAFNCQVRLGNRVEDIGSKCEKSPPPMMKRLLLVLGAALVLAGIIFVGVVALLVHGLATWDPYPPFMADYHSPFDQFVTQRFPVGSNAQDAIAKIGLERFRIFVSKPGLYLFTWDRHTGFCGEHYSIVLRQNSDGTIAEISGRKQTRCL